MKNRIISALLALGMLLFLSACGEQDTRWLWSNKAADLPEDFGNVLAMAQNDDGIYVAGYEALGVWNSEDNRIEKIDTVYGEKDPTMVYGVAAQGKTVYLLSGEMLPQYTTANGVGENPDFAGRYRVIIYENGEKSKTTEFQLSRQDILKGILALGGEEVLCWSDEAIWVIRLSDGTVSQHYKVDGSITGAVTSGSGTWLWVQKDGESACYPVQDSREALGSYIKLREDAPCNECISVSQGKDGFLSDGGMLYTFDGQAAQPYMRWSECQLTSAFVSSIVQLDADRLLCLSPGDNALYLVSRQAADSDCKELHIAASFETEELTELVDRFNRTSDEYVAVIDYYPDNSFDRLCTEIMSGNGPDIFNLWLLSIPTDTAYLEDLYPYIDADSELNREAFVPTVLSSLEVKGHLRSIPADFRVSTLAVLTADVDGATHWSFDEMRQVLAKKGGECHLFANWMNQREFLLWISSISTGSFIDWETRTAHFDSADFREYLQFCKEQDVASTNGYTGNGAPPCPYLAEVECAQNVDVMEQLSKIYAGQPFTFIGFPCSSGSGSFFESGGLHLAMSANSDEKDAAWQFIRLSLMPEYQKELAKSHVFPARMDVLTDLIDDGISDESSRRQLWELLNQPHSFTQSNLSLLHIIREEAEAYFNDTRSVEETCQLIQNRVTLYLNEIG